ncbi:MAG: hypothetical protein CSH49_11855 [Alcanivorax sp.]|nr:MAG: hypothetical protein CSH49_11855 [Alcanivorax sp.]
MVQTPHKGRLLKIIQVQLFVLVILLPNTVSATPRLEIFFLRNTKFLFNDDVPGRANFGKIRIKHVLSS